jgi:hypothetical protein
MVRCGALLVTGAGAVAAAAIAATGSSAGSGSADRPLFVPWNRIGDIALDEPRERVEREYGSVGHGFHLLQRYGENTQGYYRLHHTRVIVTFYNQRVGELGFSTPYYRSSSGFGVGSRIPLGPCHKTALNRCEHRWRGFIWNGWNKGTACRCWAKAGTGPKSLPLTARNFEKPWFFIYTDRGRVTSFYFALKFVD